MRLTDRRLYQARNLEDFLFRYYYRDEDTRERQNSRREHYFYAGESFVAPDTNQIWGVDVSGRWDGQVDFNVTAAYGARFAFTKAVDGTIPTAYWKENNKSAHDAGLLNSSYAWLYPDNRVPCKLQAKAYYELIKDAGLKLPPAIDFEWTKYAGIQANPNYADLRKWLVEFIRLSGVKPILYTAAGYIALFGAVPADILSMLSGMWVASYGGVKPLMPKGVTKWDVWQFSSNGDAMKLCPGNQGKRELDLNYMTEEFYQRYSGTTEPPQNGETMTQWYRVNADALNIRKGPGTGYADIGDLLKGQMIEVVDPPQNSWLHIKTVMQGSAVLDLPDTLNSWCSSAYCSKIEPPVTPPPPAEVYPVSGTLTMSDGTKYNMTFTKVG